MHSPRVKLAVALCFVALPLAAQPVRTFVSAASGDDTNPCSITLPCRNLQRGVDVVAANGEVVPLDSGGYGIVTISKSLTISVPSGVYAGVTAFASTIGVVVNSTGADVKLRGLSINGLGAGTGIEVSAASASVTMERLSISAFPTRGIVFNGSAGRLLVLDTLVRDSGTGIEIASTDPGNPTEAVIDHCQFSGNGGGSSAAVSAEDGARVTVHDSVAHGNFRGFQVAGVLGLASMEVEGCAATANTVGVFGTGGGSLTEVARLNVSNSVITHNTLFAIEVQTGATVNSRGNNTVIDNAGGETFTATFAAK